MLTDSNARMLQFQGGELDIVTDVPFNQLETLQPEPGLRGPSGDAAARIDYIALNVTRAPLDDKKLRQAINYAVDKDAIIQNVLFGAGVPATSYLPLMAGHDPESPGYPFDLEKAKQLVAESNSPDGFDFELLTSVGDAVGSQVCQLVAAQLAEIGGQVTVTQLEPAVQTERITVDVDYDASKSYYTTDIIDPSQLSTFAVLGDDDFKAIWTNYNNEEVDQLHPAPPSRRPTPTRGWRCTTRSRRSTSTMPRSSSSSTQPAAPPPRATSRTSTSCPPATTGSTRPGGTTYRATVTGRQGDGSRRWSG